MCKAGKLPSFWSWALSLWFLWWLAASQPAIAANVSATNPAAGSVTGTVVDTTGGLPIVGAKVELDQGSQKIAETRTDKDGSFAFGDIPPGVYALVIEASGYERSRLDRK